MIHLYLSIISNLTLFLIYVRIGPIFLEKKIFFFLRVILSWSSSNTAVKGIVGHMSAKSAKFFI